jgi:2,5-furandicarboxylate decarboxylase 1
VRQEERALPQFVADCITRWRHDPADPVVVKSGPVLDVTEPDVDLGRIPVPVHALKDAGPYFDAAVVIAKDPESGIRNASIQRFQVVNRNTLHVNIDAGRHLETYLERAKRMGRSLWITLNCGVGPGLHFAASAPAEVAPIDRDALGIASAFHGAPVELVPGTESDVEMAAHAMWALECEMIPGECAPEGPFAEVTGYYAPVATRPVVHVRRIHRRAAPVFQTMLSGAELWNSVGLLGEANALALLRRQVPGIRDVYFTHGGGGFYHAVVQIAQQRAGWSKQAILAAFAASPPLKIVTVVDDDVDIRNAQDVEWAMATRLDPASGIVRIDNAFGHGLNPSFQDNVGPKVGFDATQPFPKRAEYERIAFKAVALENYEIAGAKPALAAVRAAPAATPEPPPAKPSASDYDADRIWQRELAEWKKGGSSAEAAPAAKAAPGSDWDENRWWKRETEAMKRERAAKPAAAPPVPNNASPPARPSPQPAPRVDPPARRAASDDWDENRWWKRELEDMARERDARKAPTPAAKAPPVRPAAPPRAAQAQVSEPRRIEARAANGNVDGRAAEDEDGGFFRGAM